MYRYITAIPKHAVERSNRRAPVQPDVREIAVEALHQRQSVFGTVKERAPVTRRRKQQPMRRIAYILNVGAGALEDVDASRELPPLAFRVFPHIAQLRTKISFYPVFFPSHARAA